MFGRPNDWIAVSLLVFLALCPVPLGSNRPFFWASNVAIVGGMGLLYIALIRGRFRVRLPQRLFRIPSILWLIVVLAMVVQIIPFGHFGLYITAVSADGGQIQSSTISLAAGTTILSALRWISFGLFFLLVVQIATSRSRADWMLRAIFFIIAAHAAIALLDFAQDGRWLGFLAADAYPGAVTGTFVNRNSFASFIVMGIGIGCCMALHTMLGTKTESERQTHAFQQLSQLFCIGTGLFIMMGAIIASQSRMGTVMAVFTVLASLLLAGLKFRSGAITKFSVLAAGMTLILLLAIVLVGAGLLGRIDMLGHDTSVRLNLYSQIIEMIRAKPWTGYGAGSFEVAYPLYHREPVSPNHWWDKAHSTYLSLFAELGIVVGLLPIVVVAFFFRHALQLFLIQDSAWWHAQTALVVISAVTIHSIFDFSLEIDANAYQFLAIIGVGISVASRGKERKMLEG